VKTVPTVLSATGVILQP